MDEEISRLGAQVQFRIDLLQAEIEMLRGVGCEEDGDGPCGVCIKCAKREMIELKFENSRLRGDLQLAKKSLADLHNALPNTFDREVAQNVERLLRDLQSELRLMINPQMYDREDSRTLLEFNKLYDTRGDERLRQYDEFMKLSIDADVLERVLKNEKDHDRTMFGQMMINRLRSSEKTGK